MLAQIAEKQPVSHARLINTFALIDLEYMGLIAHSYRTGCFGVLWNMTKAGVEALGDTAMAMDCAGCHRILRYQPGGGSTETSSTICEACARVLYPEQAAMIFSGIEQRG